MILNIFYTASTYAEAKRTWIWFEHLTNKKKEEVLINLTLTECENERNAWENMACFHQNSLHDLDMCYRYH